MNSIGKKLHRTIRPMVILVLVNQEQNQLSWSTVMIFSTQECLQIFAGIDLELKFFQWYFVWGELFLKNMYY